MLVGYNSLANKGGGPLDFGTLSVSNKLQLGSDFKILKKGELSMIEDQINKYYLHIKEGTPGYEYGAGLL